MPHGLATDQEQIMLQDHLISIDEIASMLGMQYRQVRDRIAKRPDFPRPAFNLSQKMRRWDRRNVQEWIDTQAKKNAA